MRHVDSLQAAKKLLCVFNNWAAFYGGKFLTVNLADGASLLRMAKKNRGKRPHSANGRGAKESAPIGGT